MKLKCRRIRRELYLLASDRLQPADRARVEAHVQSCPECRTVLDGMRVTVKLLDTWEPEPPSNDFGFRLQRAILAHEVPKDLSPTRRLASGAFLFLGAQVWAQAAVIALVVAGGVFVYRRTGDTPATENVRDVTLSIATAPAPTPIEVIVSNPAVSLDSLSRGLSGRGSRLVRRRPVDGGLEITLSVPEQETTSVFGLLGDLGELKTPPTGYKDGDGHVIVVLRQRPSDEGR